MGGARTVIALQMFIRDGEPDVGASTVQQGSFSQAGSFIELTEMFFATLKAIAGAKDSDEADDAKKALTVTVRELDADALAFVFALFRHADVNFSGFDRTTQPWNLAIDAFVEALRGSPLVGSLYAVAQRSANRIDCIVVLEQIRDDAAFEPLVQLMRTAEDATELMIALEALADRRTLRTLGVELDELERSWSLHPAWGSQMAPLVETLRTGQTPF